MSGELYCGERCKRQASTHAALSLPNGPANVRHPGTLYEESATPMVAGRVATLIQTYQVRPCAKAATMDVPKRAQTTNGNRVRFTDSNVESIVLPPSQAKYSKHNFEISSSL